MPRVSFYKKLVIYWYGEQAPLEQWLFEPVGTQRQRHHSEFQVCFTYATARILWFSKYIHPLYFRESGTDEITVHERQ